MDVAFFFLNREPPEKWLVDYNPHLNDVHQRIPNEESYPNGCGTSGLGTPPPKNRRKMVFLWVPLKANQKEGAPKK